MPVGRILGGVYGSTSDSYVALFAPAHVKSGEVVDLEVAPFESGSGHVIAVLDRDPAAEVPLPYLMSESDAEYPASEIVPTTDYVVSYWYNVPSGEYSLRVTSDKERIDDPVTVSSESVVQVRGSLDLKPVLRASWTLPNSIRNATLAVRDLYEDVVVARIDISSSAGERAFFLESRQWIVDLAWDSWRLSQTSDLRFVRESEIRFAPEERRITGVVSIGGTGEEAEVAFLSQAVLTAEAGKEPAVHTFSGKSGEYSLPLYADARYIARIRPVRGGEFLLPLMEGLPDDNVIDFDLPGVEVEVEVLDESSGAPIEGARVLMMVTSERGFQANKFYETGEGGRVLLRPNIGKVRISVEKAGYLTSEVRQMEIVEADVSTTRDETFHLERQQFSNVFAVSLPDGKRGEGADLGIFRGVPVDTALWTGKCDGEGNCRIPEYLLDSGARLVVKHPSGGIGGRLLSGELQDIVLPRRSDPLHLKVLKPSGAPAFMSQVALAIDGVWFEGDPVHWLAGTTTVDMLGRWQVSGLPIDAAVALLAWVPIKDFSEIWPSADALSTRIDVRDPSLVEVGSIIP